MSAMKYPSSQKFLMIYSGVLTAIFAGTVLVWAMHTTPRRTKFEEIDVQRINVVEPDGTLRMTISDAARTPGLIIRNKEYPHPGRSEVAGMIFFNDEGTENGGLIFGGRKDKDGKPSSFGHLSFDNYEQDQVMVIEANQEDTEHKSSYLRVMDQPDYSLVEILDLLEKNKSLPKEQQDALVAKFMNEHSQSPRTRLFLGRSADRSVGLVLKDVEGRDRIVIQVGADGAPVLQLLDINGKVTSQLPQSTNR
jgi:hypothetical protein